MGRVVRGRGEVEKMEKEQEEEEEGGVKGGVSSRIRRSQVLINT